MISRWIIVSFVCLSVSHVTCSRRLRNRRPGTRAVRENGDLGTCELELTCRGEVNLPVKLPIKGPKGPPGNQGAKGEPGEQGPAGRPGKSAKPASKVAFFVGLGPNVGPVEQNTDLVFDKVVTNVGDTYSKQTGRFTAPYNGTYQFTVVVAAQGHQKAAADLMKSGKLVLTVWAESIPYWATSTNTAILELTQGDEVWLVLQKRACFIHGYMYSTFSGYLLFNTDDGE
ncbi:hypothetical protein CHS0354_022045 [Potamilus streckersoni]|uniref:C1q domain-containing protein n=1 Tax=Potamilus streckersoni TaxID=2493646 RepID=A0AAE0SRR4_9BIVA|nr:hypothetical protein CHS0354_022045 [Potamilus streckersoni]